MPLSETEQRARLVAKILKGPPYEIENEEELAHFFGNVAPELTLDEAHKHFALAPNHIFYVKVGDEDGEDGEGEG